jgi:hypothetical protein
MMKTISKAVVQSKSVSNVLASLRIESLSPSVFVENGMRECLAGRKSTKALLEEAVLRHVPVRRGF